MLLSFAQAIEQRHYDNAWAMLSPADQQTWSKAAFTKLFATFRKPTVSILPGTLEGAAGSSYYSAPIVVAEDGTPPGSARIAGETVLRRVNDVDGASATQRSWHFETLKL